MKIRWKMLILQLVISLGVAGLSALSTMNSMELYQSLNQPPLSPPGWLFEMCIRDRALEIGTLWVKIVAACCKQDNALGVYACGTVFEPKYYLAASQAIRQGELPIYNWVYFGLYTTDAGTSAYTYGLKPFGQDEMEVLNTQARPSDLRDYLFDLAYYVLSEDVRLNEGKTIGFSEEQKLPIIRSESAVMAGITLKIGYPEDYSSH